jgi:hypothetical protein
MEKVSIYLFFLLASSSLFSQNSGYMGKHFILKTDATVWALDREPNLEIEYVANRRITLGLQYRNFNRSYDQDYAYAITDPVSGVQQISEARALRVPLSELFPDLASEIKDGRKFKGSEFLATMKIFYKSATPAPVGLYTKLGFGMGSVNIRGIAADITRSNSGYSGFVTDVAPYRFYVENIPSGLFMLGLGHQSVVKERFIIDFGYNFVYRTFNIARVSGNYGRFTDHNLEHPNHTSRIPVVYFTVHEFNNQADYQIYLKLGVLIF